MTEMQTLGGGGALEVDDFRLLEDGSERGGALDSNIVVPQTVSKGQSGNGERSGMSVGIDREGTLRGGGALEVGDLCLLEDGGECSGTLVSDVIAPETASER